MKRSLLIEYTSIFSKQRKAAPIAIKQAFLEASTLFLEDPDHPFLRNHPLKKKFTGYRSIDVTGDWRAVFKENIVGGKKIVIFHMLGTHNQLYKK